MHCVNLCTSLGSEKYFFLLLEHNIDFLPDIHFPPSGFVYPGLQRHQAAWLSTSQNAFDPQAIDVHGDTHVLFKQLKVFPQSLFFVHDNCF